MVAIPVYDVSGKKLRDAEVDIDAVDSKLRSALLKEAHIAYWASQRQGTHRTKTRSEVQGGTKKPWRQKGTGRARAGTTRAPHWTGGGKAHGPKPRDYAYRLPKRQRALARRSAIRYRLEQGQCCVVEGLSGLDAPKTKTVRQFMQGVGIEGKGALLVSEGLDKSLHLSARNIPKVDVSSRSELNAGEVLRRPNLIFTAEALDGLLKEVSA